MINHISKRDALGDIWKLLRQTEDSSEFFKEHMTENEGRDAFLNRSQFVIGSFEPPHARRDFNRQSQMVNRVFEQLRVPDAATLHMLLR